MDSGLKQHLEDFVVSYAIPAGRIDQQAIEQVVNLWLDMGTYPTNRDLLLFENVPEEEAYTIAAKAWVTALGFDTSAEDAATDEVKKIADTFLFSTEAKEGLVARLEILMAEVVKYEKLKIISSFRHADY